MGKPACSRAAFRLDTLLGLEDSSFFPHHGTVQWSLCATSQKGKTAGQCVGQREDLKGHLGARQGHPRSKREGGGSNVGKWPAAPQCIRAWGYAVVSAGLLSESLSLR